MVIVFWLIYAFVKRQPINRCNIYKCSTHISVYGICFPSSLNDYCHLFFLCLLSSIFSSSSTLYVLARACVFLILFSIQSNIVLSHFYFIPFSCLNWSPPTLFHTNPLLQKKRGEENCSEQETFNRKK